MSAEEFGRAGAAIIETLGADRALRALAEAPGVAAALEPAVRDRVFAERPVPVEDDDDDAMTPWSNIGVGPAVPREAHARYDAAAGTITHVAAVRGSADVSEAVNPEVNAVAEPDEPDDNGGFDPDEYEDVIIAEVVDDPLPPGQTRIVAIVNSDGVPYGRTGYGRRLGRGWGLDGYRPGGRRQLPELPDPMPAGTLPTRG